MKFRFLLFLLLAVSQVLFAAEGRRDAIVVLADPSLVEHLVREKPHEKLRPDKLTGPEADGLKRQIQARKGPVTAAIRRSGVEVVADTDLLLNAVMVRATESELEALRRVPGVESAEFAVEMRLQMDAAPGIISLPRAWGVPAVGGEENAGRGIKIGIIDSGIDHTHPMLQDGSLAAPSGFPRGNDPGRTSGKVIVARSFITGENSADANGHGTFVAGVAAGRRTPAQPENGPTISITGVAPKAWLGNYRVLNASGSSSNSSVIQALEFAVSDTMDVVNISLGSENAAVPSLDPAARAIENAVAAGVLVVVAAGNFGPSGRTVGSPGTVPAALTVGASTNNRFFFATARVAGASVPAGLSVLAALPGTEPEINSVFGPGQIVDVTPLDPSGLGCPPSADFPNGVTLPPGSLNGRVALVRRGDCFFRDKVRNAAAAGATGVAIFNNVQNANPLFMDTSGGAIPAFSLGNREGLALRAFLLNGGQASITYDPALQSRPDAADLLAAFSSRGPIPGSDLRIKPDMVGPGQFILSAVQRLNSRGELYTSTGFAIEKGTSFSSPMVAGAAALVKQAFPRYTPAVLKSVMVNTADPITTSEDGAAVHAQNIGGGRLNVAAALEAVAAAEPVSLSFGARSPRGTFNESQLVKITNVGPSSDTFTFSVVPRRPIASVNVSLDQSSANLGPGESLQLLVSAANTGNVQSVADGMINVRSRSTGRSINVPYWMTFLVPEVNAGGVANGASFRSNGVAPGSIVSIFGLSLAAAEAATATSLPLPTELGGAKIVMNRINLPLFFSSTGQLNAQIPYDAQFNTFTAATASVDGISGQLFAFQVSQFAPGLFTRSQDGRGEGAILHSNGSAVSAASPARAGETIMLFGTGLGAVDNPPAAGRAALADPLSFTAAQPAVFVNNREARVLFSGLAPGFVGLYQVNVALPADLPAGDHALSLTIGGVQSNMVTISVR